MPKDSVPKQSPINSTGNSPARAIQAAEIGSRIADINVALLDAEVLHSLILDKLESFEYRERDKGSSIDAMYT